MRRLASRDFRNAISLRRVATRYSRKTRRPRESTRTPAWRGFTTSVLRQPFKLRNYVITGGVLFGPASRPGDLGIARLYLFHALQAFSRAYGNAAFNDTTESKLHENAGGGQIARNDECEERCRRRRHYRVLASADILIIADLGVINVAG